MKLLCSIRSLVLRFRIGDVLNQKLAIGLEERLHFRRERVDGLIRDQPVGTLAPSEGTRKNEKEPGEKRDEPQ